MLLGMLTVCTVVYSINTLYMHVSQDYRTQRGLSSTRVKCGDAVQNVTMHSSCPSAAAG